MRWFSIIFLLASPVVAQTYSGASQGQPDEWFSATFDGSAELEVFSAVDGSCSISGSCYRWRITDADNSGWLWPLDLNNGPLLCNPARGFTLVGTDKTSTDYFITELYDYGGVQGNVLHLSVIADDPDVSAADSRTEYDCTIDATDDPLQTFYLAFDLELQDDFLTQSCGNRTTTYCWRQLGETWEVGSDFRVVWAIDRDQAGADVWQWNVHAGYLPPDYPVDEPPEIDAFSTVTAGQVGTMLRYEVEWLLDDTSGYIKMWLNGVQIFNETGKTRDDAGDDQIGLDFMLVYTNSIIDKDGNASPSWQYTDNYKFCGSRAECG